MEYIFTLFAAAAYLTRAEEYKQRGALAEKRIDCERIALRYFARAYDLRHDRSQGARSRYYSI